MRERERKREREREGGRCGYKEGGGGRREVGKEEENEEKITLTYHVRFTKLAEKGKGKQTMDKTVIIRIF